MKKLFILLALASCNEPVRLYGSNGISRSRSKPPAPAPLPPVQTVPPKKKTPVPINPVADCSEYEKEIKLLKKKLKDCNRDVLCLEEENAYLRDQLGIY